MRDDLQPVLTPQVEMCFSGDESAIRRPRQELGEVPLLPCHPCRSLPQLGFYGVERCFFRGRDHHRCSRLNAISSVFLGRRTISHRISRSPYCRQCSSRVMPHPGSGEDRHGHGSGRIERRAHWSGHRGQHQCFSSRSSSTSTGRLTPFSSRRTSRSSHRWRCADCSGPPRST
jgi:hypothetical protein